MVALRLIETLERGSLLALCFKDVGCARACASSPKLSELQIGTPTLL